MEGDKYGYHLTRNGMQPKKTDRLYYKNDIELMTTHQLREICRKEKIISGIVNTLDKDELIQTIIRYRGAEQQFFIRRNIPEGRAALQKMLEQADISIRSDLTIEGSAKIIAYRKRGIHYYDNFVMKANPVIRGTNALIVSEDRKLCGILNVETWEQHPELLYLTKQAEVICEESAIRNYDLYCMDRNTSDLLYRIYEGEITVLPEKLSFYRMRLLDFTVNEPVELSLPLAVDFGMSRIAVGTFLDSLFFENQGIQPEHQTTWQAEAFNTVPFYDIENYCRETPLLACIIGVRSLENYAEPEFIFGYEALRELNANYADEGFCVHYDIRNWLGDLSKDEEFIDRYGNRTFIQRRIALRAYLLKVMQASEDYFKCTIGQVAVICPPKQRSLFRQVLPELLPEYRLDVQNMLDEGTSVLYGTIADAVARNKIHMKEKYKALVIDCGGRTTNMSSYTFSVINQRMSYKVDIENLYRDGDIDFGGSSITYRIMQLLKLQLYSRLQNTSGIAKRLDDIMGRFEVDIYRYVDENGAESLYAPFDELYCQAETVIPTRFKEWENLNRSDYYRVKNNYFFLFRLAERIKKRLYNQERLLWIKLSHGEAAKTMLIDKWKINIMENGALHALRDFPDMQINIFDIGQLLKADIYAIIKRFIEPMYLSGELEEYAIIKLCGQSCKIDIFRDAVSEFLPGKRIEIKRRKGDKSHNYELKLACLKGAVQYLRDKKYGFADVRVENKFLQIPYRIIGRAHTNQEVILLDGAKWEKQHGSVSRNMDDLTLQLYLKDKAGNIRCSYNYYCRIADFEVKTYEEIEAVYGRNIPQDDTDVIVDKEIKFFVWAEPSEWGFTVVPVCRYGEELRLGVKKLFYFENDTWIKGFFDGTK